VLRDVSFEVAAGSSCAIVGPSGSGKTTLLGLCAGLDRPTAGSITLAGEELCELDEEGLAALRGRAVGFVFQTFQLLPTLTAIENVMVPLELQGRRGAREQSASLLRQVGLADRLSHYPAQLSGGEQQRVAIARAFVHEPRVLFADEPTGNLDGATSALVQDLLFELNRSRGTSLVLVTHDLELARRADRVIRLRDGRREDHPGEPRDPLPQPCDAEAQVVGSTG
jgi:putative ABC transport system ATP-binding protein